MNIPTRAHLADQWHDAKGASIRFLVVSGVLMAMLLVFLLAFLRTGWVECAKIIDEALER